MSKILLGIYDEQIIVQEGICALLKDNEDIEVVLSCNKKPDFIDSLKSTLVHVLILNIADISITNVQFIEILARNFPKIKILILSANSSEELILKTIKAGAKGFLGKTAGRNEFVEAIYTLRNGHDYYSKSITHLLLNKYINNLKTDNALTNAGIEQLSSRQIEILKLWGKSYSNQQIADKLFISVRTVESHKNHVMQTLNLKNSVDLIKFGIKNNIIEI